MSQNLGQMNDKNNNVENFLKQIYENIFDQNSNRTALIFENRSISYAEVGTQVAKVMYAPKNARLGNRVGGCNLSEKKS